VRLVVTERSRIQILQVADCPLVERLIDEVEGCLADAGADEPVEVLVGDYPSPTLLIDGVDVATGQPVSGEPRCRLDLPSRAQINAAIAGLRLP
jgi:hypothetical protein